MAFTNRRVIPLEKGIQFSAHNVHAPYGFPPARERQEGCHSQENGNLIRKMKRRMGSRLRGNDRRFLTAVRCLTPTAFAGISRRLTSRCGSGVSGASRRRALRLSLATDKGRITRREAPYGFPPARERQAFFDSRALFDTNRFRRHIESAYLTTWERYQRGEPPESFAVQSIRHSEAGSYL